MREIKFRGWDKGKMLPVNTLSCGSENIDFNHGLCFSHDPECYHFSHETIYMQFTGLKDKNGVDIYEGDILRSVPRGLSQIRYSIYSAGFVAAEMDDFNTYCDFPQPFLGKFPCEVIGNIHENPELLK